MTFLILIGIGLFLTLIAPRLPALLGFILLFAILLALASQFVGTVNGSIVDIVSQVRS